MTKHDNDVVCIVDDDESLRRSLRNLLTSVGLEVQTFPSAEAFLESEHRETPCCLVLDLRMPGMGGLGLLNHLTSTGARHPVIVLTGHGDDETRRRALAAGAIAFLDKPFESDELLDALKRAASTLTPEASTVTDDEADTLKDREPGGLMFANDRPPQFAGGALDGYCHICAFFSDPEEERRVLRSFVKDGIDGGEKCLHIIDPSGRHEHLDWLRESGIDVESALASGHLEIRSWEDTYLQHDRFDQDAMLAMVDDVLQANAAAGFPLTRVLARMEWALLDKPGVDALVEYEARVNRVLPKNFAPVICAYDLTKFNASVIMDVLRTHPMVIIGGVLQENPFFVPPDEFLLELKARQFERMTASLAP